MVDEAPPPAKRQCLYDVDDSDSDDDLLILELLASIVPPKRVDRRRDHDKVERAAVCGDHTTAVMTPCVKQLCGLSDEAFRAQFRLPRFLFLHVCAKIAESVCRPYVRAWASLLVASCGLACRETVCGVIACRCHIVCYAVPGIIRGRTHPSLCKSSLLCTWTTLGMPLPGRSRAGCTVASRLPLS